MKERKVIISYFFDTYALIELYKGNQQYLKYRSGIKVFTNKLNLMEFAAFLIREKRDSEISEMFRDLSKYNLDYNDAVLIGAAKMKIRHKSKYLSYIDCIGYLIAAKNKIRFLTGDEKFRNMANVEFVK